MPGFEHTSAALPASRGVIIKTPQHQWLWYLGFILVCLVATALLLHLMGRVAICKCGTIKLWHGITLSSENSQHLTDWYTLSHIVHGFLFYGVAWLVVKGTGWRVPFCMALAAAVVVESAWELFENTSYVINRYREETISLDYYGDSIINSVSDIVAMVSGFLIARRIPAKLSVLIVLGLECFAALMIRDNLLLNIIMLVNPLESIKIWQQGG